MWYAWFCCLFKRPFACLKGFFQCMGRRFHRRAGVEPKELKKVSFYSHISPSRIHTYQCYIDRALELCPILEFEEDDFRLHELIAEAVSKDSLSELDFEIMRLQYIFADKRLREKCRHFWAERVTSSKKADFFPTPWSIISTMFSEYGRSACLHEQVCASPGRESTQQ